MNEITYPFELIPSAYGTKLKFYGEEEGRWTIDLNVQMQKDVSEKRIQLTFIGVTQARVNDDSDRRTSGKYLLMQIGNSSWVDCFLDSYVQEFGKSLLPVVKNMQHFIVRGHESSIGILARKVECTTIN
ncbi:hypothetical protein ACO0LM_23045 [Undibacterium sp. Di26W]|uniref:hypothetical protein n=1 Tax=Undibacterium TaxID=401469 RepID=UPI003BF3311A